MWLLNSMATTKFKTKNIFRPPAWTFLHFSLYTELLLACGSFNPLLCGNWLYLDGKRQDKPIKTEAVVQRYSVKKVFLKISQNSQENNCTWVSFLINRRFHSDSGTGVLRTPFSVKHLRRLLLHRDCITIFYSKSLS